MGYEQRLKENVRNYTLAMLVGEKHIGMYFNSMSELLQMDLLLVDRLGAEVACAGEMTLNDINIDMNPGKTIQVLGRTMGHFYARKYNQEELTMEEDAFLGASLKMLEKLAVQTYLQKETTCYIDERESGELPGRKIRNLEKQDGLTGVFNKSYFENRVKVIDRAEVVPVAVIIANINDWKYVHDNYGEDESDRLIQVVANILKEEAKEEYVIGRVDGDVFEILINYADDYEAEAFVNRVQTKCKAYEDSILAPSVAMGLTYKTNVEELITERASDAEYEMFQNKFDLKNEAGYMERLTKGKK